MTRRLTHAAILASFSLVLALAALVYWPGKSGPYIFDDYTNLHDNSFVKINALDAQSLYYAAYSLDSGPMRRPVAMVSFALNHYFAGSLRDATPYKLTNIGIHAVNGLLLFWLMRLIWARLAPAAATTADPLRHVLWASAPALLITLLWLVHPIQVMSVLYVIQRMTELSALFSLLAMIFYFKGRLHLATGRRGGLVLAAGGPAVCGILAVLSKENALLLPLYILLLDLALFRDQRPWSLWQQLTAPQQRVALGLIILAIIGAIVAVILYALPGYANRHFTMAERALTQGRVLFFYLSLILVPRINRFGHQHDDIELSTGLLEPWTTLPALLGHAGAISLAFWLIATRRLLAVGIGVLWFYIGHGLESTIFALEIAHEHRNYLPVAGVFLALVGGLAALGREGLRRLIFRALPVLLVVAFGAITVQRSLQWSDYNSFYRYEVLHHPDSARTHAGLAILLQAQGDHAGAVRALHRAVEISPKEPGYLVQIQLLRARQGLTPDAEIETRIAQLLRSSSATATTFLAIQHITNCLQSWCASLQTPLENWIRAILNRERRPGDPSYYYYALGLTLAAQGKVLEAVESLRTSYELDPVYLHPLFALASIQVQIGDVDGAQETLELLRQAHHRHQHPRLRELAALEQEVKQLRDKADTRTR